jgi:hypothetical protein
MSLSVVLHTSATEAEDNHIVQVYYDNDKMYAYTHVPSWDMTKITSSVITLEGKQYPSIDKPLLLSETDMPIYYLFLVDISGSNKHGAETTLFINNIMENAGDNALFLLTTFGEEFFPYYEFTSDRESIVRTIEQLHYDAKKTSLYAGIKQAIQYYDSIDRPEGALFNVIVISDGIEDDENGITYRELQQEIEKSSVTIYTFGFKSDDANSEESLKNLGECARITGGIHNVLGYDKKNEESIAQDITGYINHLYSVQFNLAEFESVGDRYMLMIEFYMGKNAVYDSLKKENVFIPYETDKPERGSEPSDPSDSSPVPNAPSPTDNSAGEGVMVENKGDISQGDVMSETTTESSNWMIWAVIGGTVLIVGVLVIAILGTSKKPSRTSDDSGLFMKIGVLNGKFTGKSDELYLNNEMLIGRSKECDIVFRDKEVSDKNTRIFMTADEIYIEDLGSQNGTAIGGMKIYSPNRLRSGDINTIGSVKFSLKF